MRFVLFVAAACLLINTVHAQDTTAQQRYNLHFQTTYIYQYKPAFSAPYSGANSLLSKEEKDNSITATLFLGVRLWKGAEVYINPEIAGGSGLSGAFGLAASTNGETFRVGDPSPTLYLGRGYLKQTIAIGTDSIHIEEHADQLGSKEPVSYLRFMLGKYSLGDVFDINTYANSPRIQFMNWALMNNAAWDYAANTRGYTYAFSTILKLKEMSYMASLAMLPKVANGPEINTDLSQEYAINAEIDRSYNIHNMPGNWRVLGYYNNADMGNYKRAMQDAGSITVPDVIATRKYGRTKTGFGINVDQQLSATTGVFARLGWSDGQNETWCFTEADQTVSAGVNVNGKGWKRGDDNLGLALVVNGLSQNHRDYLADGGLGFQLGDGKLNYSNETAAELYYSFKPLSSGIWLTGDYQFVLNPGYNSDRGPVNVFSFRVHVEL
ncbi:MAG: carbohydrate porin [Flavipsychrobacter sp.]|nr:carbohydrate porin [Flavipsychrobacter sp.]